MLFKSLILLFFPGVAFSQPDFTPKSVDSFLCFLHETPAEFPGGQIALSAFVRKNIYFPKGTEDIQGRVILSFAVLKDGSVKNIKVVKSLTPKLDSVALRMAKKMPHWKPATLLNKPVDSHYILPIKFIPR